MYISIGKIKFSLKFSISADADESMENENGQWHSKWKLKNLMDSVRRPKKHSSFSYETIDSILMEHTFYGLAWWIHRHTSYLLRGSRTWTLTWIICWGVVYVDSKELPCIYYLVINLLGMIHLTLGNNRYALHVFGQKRWEDSLHSDSEKWLSGGPPRGLEITLSRRFFGRITPRNCLKFMFTPSLPNHAQGFIQALFPRAVFA